MRIRIFQKSNYPLSVRRFLLSWLVSPIALILDAIATLFVKPFGYDCVIYDTYLMYSLKLLHEEGQKKNT